jgi:hypothetical protein
VVDIPKLDDVTFDKLVEEAWKRISQFTPEWTDNDLHDPGVAFIELLTFLVEMKFVCLDLPEFEQQKLVKIVCAELQKGRTLKETFAQVKKTLHSKRSTENIDKSQSLRKTMKGLLQKHQNPWQEPNVYLM